MISRFPRDYVFWMTYVLGTDVCFIIYMLSIVLEECVTVGYLPQCSLMLIDRVTVGYVLGRNQLLLLVVEFV